MRNVLLASVCALACAGTPALAQGVAATAQGTFGNIAGAASWSVDGAVSVPLDWNGLSVEGNLGDRGASFLHVFDGGGSVVWSGMDVRLAASVLYNRLSGFGGSANETQFGGGGEWYVLPSLTASVIGGGIAGTQSGGYVGGTLKWYFDPDIALDGFVHYTSVASAHETDFGAHAEWLPMEDLPISVGATYTHINLSGGGFGTGNTDTWWVGLKLYLNDSPATTLTDRQRTGTLDTIAPGLHFIF
jgi:hypothetical protein